MKKSSVILVISIIIMFVAGCSNSRKVNEIFKGENKDWSAQYTVDEISSESNSSGKIIKKAEKELIITYKNDLSDLSSVKKIVFSFESKTDSHESSKTFTNEPLSDKKYILKFGSENSTIENKDDVIKVTINIDGKEQTLQLKSE